MVNLKQVMEVAINIKPKLEPNSDNYSHLEIKEEGKFNNSIVDYNADGGGNIAVKVEEYNKKFHTSQSITTFDIDEQLLKNNNWNALDNVFREVLI